MDPKLLTLPWEIQIALGGGYAAYVISYMGIREHHKSVDTAFRAIAFGLIATACLALIPRDYPFIRVSAAIIATLAAGVVWRFKGLELCRRILRWGDVTWSDDLPSAWVRITGANSRHPITQISVQLDDGSWLNCDSAGRFNDAAFGPCYLGGDGDIALYVTDEENPSGEIHNCSDVCDEDWGDRLTYVPAARVRRIAMRHLRPKR